MTQILVVKYLINNKMPDNPFRNKICKLLSHSSEKTHEDLSSHYVYLQRPRNACDKYHVYKLQKKIFCFNHKRRSTEDGYIHSGIIQH